MTVTEPRDWAGKRGPLHETESIPLTEYFPFLEVSRLLPRSTAWEERLPTAMRGTVPQSRRHLLAFASLCKARGKACFVPQGVEVMAPGGGDLRVGYFGLTIAEVLESFSCFLCQFERQHVGRQFSSQR